MQYRVTAEYAPPRYWEQFEELCADVARLRVRGGDATELPERLLVVEALPKTASGKVQKFRLRERLHGKADEAVTA